MSNYGVTENTVENVIIDTGEVFIGYASAQSPGTSLGALKGGATFEIARTIRDFAPDGAKGPVKGFRRVEEVKATLKASMYELSATNIAQAIAGATNTEGTITGGEVSDENYSDIALVGQDARGGDIVLILKNALADGPFSFKMTPKGESVVEVTFTAHYDPEDLATEPWEIIRLPAGS